jgi:hypothetical protein
MRANGLGSSKSVKHRHTAIHQNKIKACLCGALGGLLTILDRLRCDLETAQRFNNCPASAPLGQIGLIEQEIVFGSS